MSETAAFVRGIRALRGFARRRPDGTSCNLCGARLEDHSRHRHLYSRSANRVICACDHCARLHSNSDGDYQRIPRSVASLGPFALSEGDWHTLGVPIRLVFFSLEKGDGTVVTCAYPSPAGAVPTPLDEAQRELVLSRCPAVARLEPVVEAVLLADLPDHRFAFSVPIDECFRLVGLLRRNFRGFSGGPTFWSALAEFQKDLALRAKETRHA